MTRPKKLPGLTMQELHAKTGIGKHTIYGWIRAGLLPRPTSSGRGVRYDDAFVERVQTIAQLRGEGLHFGGIRHHLEDATSRSDAPAPSASPAAPPSERWERIMLLPGLELCYRTDGGPVLRRLAGEIWKQFGAGAK
ncbi:MAG TPA: MerR family transcriptional regulator [Polyangia bacterium]|jgi:DNA-binding transcriptional MerR regulator|nr:MerR family transcriptional regulator [Polyangia bacterium]